MGLPLRPVVSLAILTIVLGQYAGAQESIDNASARPDAPSSALPAAATLSDQLPHPNERYFFKHLAQDQAAIWTSPAHITASDLKWLVPAGGIATGLFATDPDSSWGMTSYHPQAWKDVSNYGLGAAFATTAGMYAWGFVNHNERPRARPVCWRRKQ